MLRNVLGRTLSRQSTSLAKRLRTRPTGVVSKKDMGWRMTRASIADCIRRAALSEPTDSSTDATKMAAAARPRPPNPPANASVQRQLSLRRWKN